MKKVLEFVKEKLNVTDLDGTLVNIEQHSDAVVT
jgi:trehalose-6-phosphatase